MNWIRPKRPIRVTIIVGIITKSGIVLASDSQTTYGFSSKRCETDKISAVTFRDKSMALIAESGEATVSARIVEEFAKLASQTAVDEYRKPADLLQSATKKVKKELVELNNWDSRQDWPQLLDQHFSGNPVKLMLAYYFDSKPLLFVNDVSMGFSTKVKHPYASIGCGATVADYILNQFRLKENPGELYDAIVLGIYAVEKVKEVDSYCDGPTKIGIICGPNDVRVTTSPSSLKLMSHTVEIIQQHDAKTTEAWRGKMHEMLAQATSKWKAEHDMPPSS